MKVSIIIPVYNSAIYLEKCINSILTQTYTNFELILVNDASRDNSKDICLGFVNKDSRIKYLENYKNLGVSATRNKGILASQGDFITFCDNDDHVSSDWLLHLVNIIERDSLVMPISSIAKTESDLGSLKDLKIGDIIYNSSDVFSFYEQGIAGYIWNTIFKRQILIDNNIVFESRKELGDINEDLIFFLKYIKHIKKVKYTGYSDYYHCINETNHGNVTDKKFYFEKYREKYNLWYEL